jgi:hypothetical protein
VTRVAEIVPSSCRVQGIFSGCRDESMVDRVLEFWWLGMVRGSKIKRVYTGGELSSG